MDRKSIRNVLLQALETCVDNELIRYGLQRRHRSTTYSRRTDHGKQEVAIDFDMPRYSDDPSIAHLFANVHLVCPDVDRLFLAATRSMNAGPPNRWTLNMPIGLLGPERTTKDWRPLCGNEVAVMIVNLKEYVVDWVIPFLDEYQAPASLLKGYEHGDDRFLGGYQWAIIAACCAHICGFPEKARDIVENTFSKKLGLRRQYRTVLEFFLGK